MKNLEQSINQCVRYFNQKNYQYVVDHLPALMKVIPFNVQLYYILAKSERFTGNTKASERSFIKLLKKHRNEPMLFCGYGNLLVEMKEYDKAEQQFKSALLLNQKSFDATFNLARLYYQRNQLELAVNHYKTASHINPEHQDSCIGLVSCMLEQNQILAAKSHCIHFIQAHKNSAKVKHKLAQIYHKLGDKQSCIQLFSELCNTYPENFELGKSFVACAISLGESQLIIELAESLLQKNPNDVDIQNSCFELLWLQESENCFIYFEQYFSKLTNDEIIYSYCKKLIKLDKFNEVISILERYYGDKTKSIIGYVIYGHALRELGRFEQALIELNYANKLYNNKLDLIYEIVITYLCIKDYEKALKLAKRLINLAGWHQGYWALYASCLRFSGNLTEYRRLYDYDKFVKIYSLPAPKGYSSKVDFNRELVIELEKLQHSNKHPIEQSLRHGRQTSAHLFDYKSQIITEFKDNLTTVIDTYIKSFKRDSKHPLLKNIEIPYYFSGAWSVELTKNGFHKNHYHHQGWISGPYYVAVPEDVLENGQGWLKLGQPELSRWLTQEPEYLVKPEAGKVILFPSYMWHGTVPITGNSKRVCIAFDVTPY